MKKIPFTAIIITFIFFGVFYFFNNKTPKHIHYANKINNAFKAYVSKEYELTPSREGGSLMENVKMVSLSFRTLSKEYSIEEARELMIFCIQDYLRRINADEKIRPYLNEYPFNANNLELHITFYQRPLVRVNKGFVSSALIVNGKIYYLTYDHEKGKSEDLYEETYEEAVRIVKEGK